MMTMLVRKIYKEIDDPETFFRNISLIESALSRSSQIQGGLARKFFTLESLLGNLQRVHEGTETIIDIGPSGNPLEYDEFGMPIPEEADELGSDVPPFEDDDEYSPL